MKSRFRMSDEPEYVGRCETIYSNPYQSSADSSGAASSSVPSLGGVEYISPRLVLTRVIATLSPIRTDNYTPRSDMRY